MSAFVADTIREPLPVGGCKEFCTWRVANVLEEMAFCFSSADVTRTPAVWCECWRPENLTARSISAGSESGVRPQIMTLRVVLVSLP